VSLVSEAHRRHWQQRRRQEAERIAVRREQAKRKAEAAAALLKQHWPQIQAVWLFGSVLEPGFGLRSDLDLCVEGLPADALFAAMHQVDQLQRDVADPELLIPVDLVRLEALPEHWQKRIRERARLLLP
jgi:predicted nucleotidyltransferase